MTYAQYLRLELHVSASDRDLVRKALRRMVIPSARYARDNREVRHEWLRDLLAEHHDARQQFLDWRF